MTPWVWSVCPILLGGRLLQCRIIEKNYAWDELIGKEFRKPWEDWMKLIPVLKKLTFPRNVLTEGNLEVQLHVFADWSKHGIGCAVYIRSAAGERSRSPCWQTGP